MASTRRSAQIAVETAAQQLETILELTRSYPFLVDIDAEGSVSLAWMPEGLAKQFGYTLDQIEQGGGPLSIIAPEDRSRALEIVQDLMAGRQPGGDLRLTAGDGSTHWFRMHYTASVGPYSKGSVRLFGVAQDVTEEVEARRTFEENAARFRAIFEQSPFGHVIVSADRRFVAVNPRFCRITGYSEEELVGQSAALVVDPSFLGPAVDRAERLRRLSDERHEYESVWRTKDGRRVEVELTALPERNSEGKIHQFVVAVRDVTERNRASAQMDWLVTRLRAAHAEERVRLARELHDGLGQLLTSASLYASSIEDQAPEALAGALATLRSQLDEALAATRTLVWRLRPVEVDELGLAGAVTNLAIKIRRRHGIQVDVHTTDALDLVDPVVEAAAYRVVQEAVTNAVKHACPQTISIVVTLRGPRVVVVVEDDGSGFDATLSAAGAQDSGAGIIGMRERAASVGGELVIESEPGRGTLLRFEAPVGAAQK
jgi:PAS domain S-box-containing protein